MSALRKGNIAFWGYDLYPYFLYGTISKVRQSALFNGGTIVETVEYGVGHGFRPSFVLPPKKGRELGERLMALRGEYRERKDEVRDAFKERARRELEALPEVVEQLKGRTYAE